jgi:hypothetical protein
MADLAWTGPEFAIGGTFVSEGDCGLLALSAGTLTFAS